MNEVHLKISNSVIRSGNPSFNNIMIVSVYIVDIKMTITKSSYVFIEHTFHQNREVVGPVFLLPSDSWPSEAHPLKDMALTPMRKSPNRLSHMTTVQEQQLSII